MTAIPRGTMWSRGIPFRAKADFAGSFDLAQDDAAWKLVKLKNE